MAAPADTDATPQGAVARARYVRMSPMKVRRVVDLVRGMPVGQAASVLQFAEQAAAGSTITVDEGPTMKRFQPRAQGRAYRIRKRTSHITVEVTSVPGGKGGRQRSKGRTR